MLFVVVFIFLVAQRITELIIARKNERWLLSQGAVEYGHAHYRWIVLMHTCFILSIVIEYLLQPVHTVRWFLLVVYLVLVACKAWVIGSLGKYWNTKIYRVPNMTAVKKGPYKFVRHPNYLIVMAEILVIPLIFNLYITAILFSLLNLLVLSVRIREENRVWKPL